ncbi:MAG TPA: uracil phosphoribosyltransferase [Chryseolinea sp.]|nr:uracil phosphoribosyltransferase [Chryseolinea sp.]
MIFNLSAENTLANEFLWEMRNQVIQRDRSRFRKNMKRLGNLMAYEISKKMIFKNKSVETPLAKSSLNVLETYPVLLTVMRAGLPYFDGFLDFFDQSDCGFMGAYRQEDSEEIIIQLDYVATPQVSNRPVILIDPMLATGKSIVRSVQALLKHGNPSHIYIAALVAAPEGIQFVTENLKIPHSLWTCAVDESLNHQFYIVPGLGDAGDLSFGVKL